MSSRGFRLLLYTVLVSSLVCYIFYLNREPATVHLGPSAEYVYTGPMALVLVVAFFLGVFIAAVFAFLVGIRYQMKDWRHARLERTRENHRHLLIAARERLAAHRFSDAADLLRKIIAEDPDDIIARVQLGQALFAQGKAVDARAVLDEARAEKEKNIELLFLAADIDRTLGNHTGAMDNLHLVLAKEGRNLRALQQLVSDYASLERYEQALEQQRLLVRYAQTNSEQQLRLDRLAELELLQAQKDHNADQDAYKSSLHDILSRHRDFVPALAELALVEREDLSLDTATKLLVKAYKLEPNVEFLRLIAEMYLAAEEPQKAVANIRNAMSFKETTLAAHREAQLLLISLLIRLENVEEAAVERQRFGTPAEYEQELRLVDAVLMRRNGDISDAFDALLTVDVASTLHPSLGWLIPEQSPAVRNWVERLRMERRAPVQPAPRLLTN